jgi:hypothetical protein
MKAIDEITLFSLYQFFKRLRKNGVEVGTENFHTAISVH